MDDPLLAPRAAFHGHRNLRAEMSTMPLHVHVQHSCNPTSPRASRPQSSQMSDDFVGTGLPRKVLKC